MADAFGALYYDVLTLPIPSAMIHRHTTDGGKDPMQAPISESADQFLTVPSTVASSMSSAAGKPSAVDCMSSLGVRAFTPGAARALGAYSKASHDNELAKHESYRLSTFADVWVYDHIVDARELARNGFFYAGPGDRVQCAFCHGLLQNWELGDHFDEQHAQHFIYCRFVQGHDVNNVPIPFRPLVATQTVEMLATDTPADATGADLGIICSPPKNPEFAIEVRRLATYRGWPHLHRLQQESIAKAGFFYFGNDDAVKCFFCGGTVADWRTNCDPWVKHAQRFRDCASLLQVIAHGLVQRHIIHDEPRASTSKPSLSVDPRELKLESISLPAVGQMDYLMDLIRDVVQRRLATVGSDHETSEQLLDEVFWTHYEKQKASSNGQNAASFTDRIWLDVLLRGAGVVSGHLRTLTFGSSSGGSLREVSNKRPCSLQLFEEKSIFRRRGTSTKQHTALLVLSLLVQLLGALNESWIWPNYHLAHLELEITRTAVRLGCLGCSGQGVTILLPDPRSSLQPNLPEPASWCPVDLPRSLSRTSPWLGLAVPVDFRWIDGFNNVQIESSMDKPAMLKLVALHDNRPVDVLPKLLNLSLPANSPCEANAEFADKDRKASAKANFCCEIAGAFTVASGFDAKLKTAPDVDAASVIKNGESFFVLRSACASALECVTRDLEGDWPRPNSLLCSIVVRTSTVRLWVSATSVQQCSSSNLQRLAKLAIGSYQAAFDMELFRLASLADWPHLGKMSALRCSSAGFHRKTAVGPTSARGDVACFSCGCTVERWAAGVHPISVHRHNCAQHCRYVIAPLRSGNVPIGKDPIQVPISESADQFLTVPSTVASSMSSAAGKPSAADCLSSLGVRAFTPGAVRALGAYSEASVATIACGSSLVKKLNAASTQADGVQSSAGSAPPTHDNELAKHESYRLGTFADVWVYDHIVDARELARNGFVYAGPGDHVQCAFCKRLFRNWVPGDRINEQHFTYCRFAQGQDVGNVPIAFWPLVTKQTAGERAVETGVLPKNPEFAIEARRLATFATWPPTHQLQPEVLARAGFFYLGIGNAVRCFFCDGTVVDCRADCDPRVEHVQRFPNCPFLRLETGHYFVRQDNVLDEPASSDWGASSSVDRRLNQEGPGPASSNLSASTCTDRTHQVREELAYEFAYSREHLLHLEPRSSDRSTSVSADSRVRQVHDHESPRSSRSASFSADSNAYDLHDEPAPSTLTTNVSAVCRACQVRDEPASSTLRTSCALDSREVTARMDSNKVRIVLEMDYSSDLIRGVIQKRLATCEGDHETSEQILDDIFRTDDEKHKPSSA